MTIGLMMDNNTTAATQLVAQLVQGDFVGAWQRLANDFQNKMSAEQVQKAWQGIIAQCGPFKEQIGTHILQIKQIEMVIVTCAFAHASVDVNVAFNSTGEIVGVSATPTGYLEQQVNATYEPPAYVQSALFREQEVQIGQGEWVLPGTLSLPVGDGPFPAVVLVHGSGPQDRDEAIGPNMPFRDLAWGLASQGIAVLRYDKRTRVYGEKMSQLVDAITVQTEVIDDALAAVALLRYTTQIDPHRICVLGHSLGGYVLPRIGSADPAIAGLIVLAGLVRPLEDTILEQFTYIYSLTGTLSAEQREQLDALAKQVALVKSPALSLATPATDLPMGMSPAYWLDLRGYQPAKMAQHLKQPMLILQAESDYQVTMEDFQGWQDALATRGNVQFKSYPGLSHLFMPVEGGGKATPGAYMVPGHVTEEVVSDIARWVQTSLQ
nr:alpha/beta fold hydrolase [Ktedonobacteraceae bacterium]